jgi:ribosomal protein L18E
MSTTREFYIARAEESATEAKNATLANVRERAERSAAAWREMAERMERVERQRVVAEQARAERIAAEG